MIQNIQELFKTLESGTREEIWEAAKQLESLILDVSSLLLRDLKRKGSSDTRAAAAYVLGFGHLAIAGVPLEGLVADAAEEATVRGHAAEALAYVGDTRSAHVLRRQLDDVSAEVRYWSIFALGQIGDPSAADALRHIAESVKDEIYQGHSVREEARKALEQIRGNGSVT